MVGILVQLAISYLLILFIEKKGLNVLGFRPTRQRVLDFFLFLFLTAAICSTGFFMRMYFGERWVLNPAFNFKLLVDGLWWNIKSVLFEELIFRGVILYILIRRIGMRWAIIISSVAFGIYHWFSFEILGQVFPMIMVFIITGLMGMVYAYAYAKTLSLYIPIAIHLGWNFTHGFVFSQGSIGNGILVHALVEKETTVSYFTYYFVQYFPLVAVYVVHYLLLRRKKPVEIHSSAA